MASHMQVPCAVRKGESYYRGEKEVGRAIVDKESVAFHWLSPCQERRLSSSCSALLLLQGVRAPPAGLPTLFN